MKTVAGTESSSAQSTSHIKQKAPAETQSDPTAGLREQEKAGQAAADDLAAEPPLRNWQSIIWRAWYHMPDQEIADLLFKVANQSTRGWSRMLLFAPLVVFPSVVFGVLGLLTILLMSCFGVGWLPIPRLIKWLGKLTVRDIGRYGLRWAFWWWRRPHLLELEQALRHAGIENREIGEQWHSVLRRLEHYDRPRWPVRRVIQALSSSSWTERFLAWHELVLQGGEVISELEQLITGGDKKQHAVAIDLIQDIAHDTRQKLDGRFARLICPRCLTRCDRHTPYLGVPWRTRETYFGCRTCRQSREFLEADKVTAVLDRSMTAEHHHHDGTLRVNALRRQTPFDFDRVEIVQAGDQDVERFVLRVANDTDVKRKKRYRRMRCTMRAECKLGENTLRVLARVFGEVERVPFGNHG